MVLRFAMAGVGDMAFLDELDNLHEHQRLEFKEAAGGLPDDVWETYAAFANTEGGEIVLGVREDKGTASFEIVGVSDADALAKTFWDTVRNPKKVSRDVMLPDGVRAERVKGTTVLVIAVPRAERADKPVEVWDKREKGMVSWVRRASADMKCTPSDIRLMEYDAILSADRAALRDVGFDALNAETIRLYRTLFAEGRPSHPWRADDTEDFLYHIGAVAKGSDGRLHPTRAGLLAFGNEYEITAMFPHYLLDYREETSGERRWDDRIVSSSGDWSGNLVDFYFSVTNRLDRALKTPFTRAASGMRHLDTSEINDAVHEAVANALIHAYYGLNSTLSVVLGSDELVVTNAGTFLLDRDVAVAGGLSEARNPTLMRIFGHIGVVDRAGSGLFAIFDTWRRFGLGVPTLSESHAPAEVRVVLPLGKGSLAPRSPRVAEDDLLTFCAERGRISAAEVAAHFATTPRNAQKRLKALEENGSLVHVREGRAYWYEVAGG